MLSRWMVSSSLGGESKVGFVFHSVLTAFLFQFKSNENHTEVSQQLLLTFRSPISGPEMNQIAVYYNLLTPLSLERRSTEKKIIFQSYHVMDEFDNNKFSELQKYNKTLAYWDVLNLHTRARARFLPEKKKFFLSITCFEGKEGKNVYV